MEAIDIRAISSSGKRVVALGTGYFIAKMLSLAAVDTSRLFIPLGQTGALPSSS
jgi:hypothetical protein